jgi:hypothetical protein
VGKSPAKTYTLFPWENAAFAQRIEPSQRKRGISSRWSLWLYEGERKGGEMPTDTPKRLDLRKGKAVDYRYTFWHQKCHERYLSLVYQT